MGYHQVSSSAELTALLSAERLGTYQRHAPTWGCGPVELYLLGVELASSYMADLALLEVILRNAMHEHLSVTYGFRWWAEERLFDDRSQTAVVKAVADSRYRDGDPSGRVLAQLPFDFWVHLLETGDYTGEKPYRQRRSYDELLWKPALHRAFPHSGGRRTDVHAVAHRVYALRNRVAHHEPLIAGVRMPGAARGTPNAYRSPREIHSDIVTLLCWISEPVGDWLATHSRTPDLLDRCP